MTTRDKKPLPTITSSSGSSSSSRSSGRTFSSSSRSFGGTSSSPSSSSTVFGVASTLVSVLEDLSLDSSSPREPSPKKSNINVKTIIDNSIFYEECGCEDSDHDEENAKIVLESYLNEWKDVYSQVKKGRAVHCKAISRKGSRISLFSFSTRSPNTDHESKKTKKKKKVRGKGKISLKKKIRQFTHFISYDKKKYTGKDIIRQCVDDILYEDEMKRKWKKLHEEGEGKNDVYCMVKDLGGDLYIALYLAGTMDELFKNVEESGLSSEKTGVIIDESASFYHGDHIPHHESSFITPLSSSECEKSNIEKQSVSEDYSSYPDEDHESEEGDYTCCKGCPSLISSETPHSDIHPSSATHRLPPLAMEDLDKELIGIILKKTHFYRVGGISFIGGEPGSSRRVTKDNSVEAVRSCAKDIVASDSRLFKWDDISQGFRDVYCLFTGLEEKCVVIGLYRTLKDLREDEKRAIEFYSRTRDRFDQRSNYERSSGSRDRKNREELRGNVEKAEGVRVSRESRSIPKISTRTPKKIQVGKEKIRWRQEAPIVKNFI